MIESSRTEIRPEQEGAVGPSKAMAFLSKAAPVLLSAAVMAGIAAVGLRYDAYINADLVATLKENWSWTRMLSSHHSMTVLSQMYPGIAEGIYALAGGIGAYMGCNSKSHARERWSSI